MGNRQARAHPDVRWHKTRLVGRKMDVEGSAIM